MKDADGKWGVVVVVAVVAAAADDDDYADEDADVVVDGAVAKIEMKNVAAAADVADERGRRKSWMMGAHLR